MVRCFQLYGLVVEAVLPPLGAGLEMEDAELELDSSVRLELFRMLSTVLLSESELLESEFFDSELALDSSSSVQAPYIKAHLESLMTNCRLPLTRTASTVSGIFQSEAWFSLSRYCMMLL